MIQIRTRPLKTRPARVSTGLNQMSSMRATLNSRYCMRAQISAPILKDTSKDTSEEQFSYQEGQHRLKRGQNRSKAPFLEEIKITNTKNGKRWSTSSIEVELAKDILEIRNALGKIIDALILK